MSSREVIAILKSDGWKLSRIKGSHHIFEHSTKLGALSVPHPKKDLGKGLVKSIMKQAGLR